MPRRFLSTLLAILIFSVVLLPASAQDCPRNIGSWQGDSAGVVAAFGVHTYTGNQSGMFRVFDVSDPSAPIVTGEIGFPGEVEDIEVSGALAYVIAADWLWVIDVSAPAAPDWVGFANVPGAVSVAVSGVHAFVAAGAAGLRVLDVTDPSSPTEVGSCGAMEWEAWDVAASETFAYVVGSGSLRVIDVSNQASPTQVGSCEWSGNGVVVSEGYAYVWRPRGWGVIDVRNPLVPTLEWEHGSWANHADIAVLNRVLYLCNTTSEAIPPRYLLTEIDISDPVLPEWVGDVEPPGTSRSVAVSNGYVYLAEGDAGVGVYEGCNFGFVDSFESGDTSRWSATVP